jgi:hypothetical protein
MDSAWSLWSFANLAIGLSAKRVKVFELLGREQVVLVGDECTIDVMTGVR